ncbi:MAG: hemerythrin domain-containing protein [Acidimicrobiales bacterium]
MCDHCGCRAYAPIAELTAEHEEILTLAWSLVEATRQERQPDQEVVDHLLARLDVHVAKEEYGLYPELAELSGLGEAENAKLEEEHRVIRDAIVAGAFDHHAYYALAAHIEVEELELFSTAMFLFEDPEWSDLETVHASANNGAQVPVVDYSEIQANPRPNPPSDW